MERKIPRVMILSPYKGNIEQNLAYARRCLKHSAMLREAPLASHVLYPMILNDTLPEERSRGFEIEAAWLEVCDKVAVYEDLGISSGMSKTIATAIEAGKHIVHRKIGKTDAKVE